MGEDETEGERWVSVLDGIWMTPASRRENWVFLTAAERTVTSSSEIRICLKVGFDG